MLCRELKREASRPFASHGQQPDRHASAGLLSEAPILPVIQIEAVGGLEDVQRTGIADQRFSVFFAAARAFGIFVAHSRLVIWSFPA
jgi:hypothetical protein